MEPCKKNLSSLHHFPDHKPNTCPPLEEPAAASGDKLVSQAVAKIIGAVTYYQMWPPEGKRALEKAVAKGMSGETRFKATMNMPNSDTDTFTGIFEFVKNVVDDEKNHFGLKSADESVKKEIMAELMKGSGNIADQRGFNSIDSSP